MRWVVIACLLLPSARAFSATVSEICLSCQQPIRTSIYLKKSPYYEGSQSFCASCAVLKTTCFTCQLPFLKFLDLKDGRILCPKDAKTAVLSGDQAESIFHD